MPWGREKHEETAWRAQVAHPFLSLGLGSHICEVLRAPGNFSERVRGLAIH